jgi:histidine triad (HIT) family protein
VIRGRADERKRVAAPVPVEEDLCMGCVFCWVVASGQARWVAQREDAVALLPLPDGEIAPGHTLVVPREHAIGVQDVSLRSLVATTALLQEVSQAMTRAIGAPGVVVLNASGAHSGQSVDHPHFHVVPCWEDDQADFWPEERSAHAVIPDAHVLIAAELA